MLKTVTAFYDEITPLGTREHFRSASAELDPDYYDTNPSIIRKAVTFLLKLDRNGNRLCDSVRFDFDDHTSWFCEYKWDDCYKDNKLITVEVTEYDSSVESYKTDKASLQRRLLAMLPKKDW